METATTQPPSQSSLHAPSILEAAPHSPVGLTANTPASTSVPVAPTRLAASAVAKPNPNRWLIRLRKLHGWFGVVLALFLILMGVTGILLNHKSWLERLPQFTGWAGSKKDKPSAGPSANHASGGESHSPPTTTQFLTTLEAVVQKLGEVNLVCLEYRKEAHSGYYRVKATDGLEWRIDMQGSWHKSMPAKHKAHPPLEPTALSFAEVVQLILAQVDDQAVVQKIERCREHDMTIYRVRLNGQREAIVTPDGTMSMREPKNKETHSKKQPRPKGDKHDKHHLSDHSGNHDDERQKPKGKINWPKLIKDIHTGKILGISGQLLADLTAVSLIFFSLSGIYLWVVPILRKRRKPVGGNG